MRVPVQFIRLGLETSRFPKSFDLSRETLKKFSARRSVSSGDEHVERILLERRTQHVRSVKLPIRWRSIRSPGHMHKGTVPARDFATRAVYLAVSYPRAVRVEADSEPAA